MECSRPPTHAGWGSWPHAFRLSSKIHNHLRKHTPDTPPLVKGVLHPAFVLTKSDVSKGQSLPQNSLGLFQGFHLLFCNKANKEKYYFALLIFFFLLRVYVCVCLRDQLAM